MANYESSQAAEKMEINELKQSRVTVRARLAPTDAENLTNRARREGRSMGELLTLLLYQNEWMAAQLQKERELINGASGG